LAFNAWQWAVQVVRTEDMVAEYIELFARMAAGGFIRRPGEIVPPPAEVGGVSIFPVPLPIHRPDLGCFPSEDDLSGYLEEIAQDEQRAIPQCQS
jgi:hypothetical protein